jgi:hypothetical protein
MQSTAMDYLQVRTELAVTQVDNLRWNHQRNTALLSDS